MLLKTVTRPDKLMKVRLWGYYCFSRVLYSTQILSHSYFIDKTCSEICANYYITLMGPWHVKQANAVLLTYHVGKGYYSYRIGKDSRQLVFCFLFFSYEQTKQNDKIITNTMNTN